MGDGEFNVGKKAALTFLLFLGISSINALSFFTRPVKGVTLVEGHITSDTTWTPVDIYRVVNQTYVDHGVTLTIEPGVHVEFNDGLSLVVDGSLNATGTESEPIIFTSSNASPTPGAWKAISFTGNTGEQLLLRQAKVEYAVHGVTVKTLAPAVIEENQITNSLNNGIVASAHNVIGNVVVSHNNISSNGGSGISFASYDGPGFAAGIRNITVSHNTISSNGHGILMSASGGSVTQVTISSNTILSNIGKGVSVVSGGYHSGGSLSKVTVSSNNISFNGGAGINIGSGPGMFGAGGVSRIIISSNTVSCNGGTGIGVGASAGPMTGPPGINNVSISFNNVSSNGGNGVVLNAPRYKPHTSGGAVSRATILENSITDNGGAGVHMNFSSGSNNTLCGNNIANNSFGVRIPSSENKVYHNNFINNTQQVYIVTYGNANIWDDGYPSGGNCWYDYAGVDSFSGPYQNETGGDGIGDTPYVIDEYNRDNYPLMEPTIDISVPPFAFFTCVPSSLVVNETVTLNASASVDLDGNIVNYAWNFGDGTNSTHPSPIETHAYRYPDVYAVTLTVTGNDGLCATATKSVRVGKLSSSISISASPSQMPIGEETRVSGCITPIRAGVNVTIWHTLSGGVAWGILTTVLTNESGGYSFVWIPPEIRTYKLKASWLGDEYTLPDETLTTVVCTKITTSVSIVTSSSSTLVGFRVNVTGTLNDIYGNWLRNKVVVLYYTFSGISTWTPITSDVTDNVGNYRTVWIPPATGNFILRAEWTGNATYFGANNTATLSSLAYNDEYILSVESNSTVSEFAFNTTDWTLSFTATGPDNTEGYVKITVANNLVENIGNIKAYLDGEQTSFSTTSTDDSWLIAFTYTHSTHQVIVDLDVNIVPEPLPLITLPLFIMVTLVAVAAYKGKRFI